MSHTDADDITLLNVVIALYPLMGILCITAAMVQPFFWYIAGGPLFGTRPVFTILPSILDAIPPTTWLIAFSPLAVAIVVVMVQRSLHRITIMIVALFLSLVPLPFFGAENVFAPLSKLRVEYRPQERVDATKIWMFSKNGTTLQIEKDSGEKTLLLSEVSNAMVDPVRALVRDEGKARFWTCDEPDADSGFYLIKSGLRRVTVQGCEPGSKDAGRITQLTEMESFDVETLLMLVTSKTL